MWASALTMGEQRRRQRLWPSTAKTTQSECKATPHEVKKKKQQQKRQSIARLTVNALLLHAREGVCVSSGGRAGEQLSKQVSSPLSLLFSLSLSDYAFERNTVKSQWKGLLGKRSNSQRVYPENSLYNT